MTVEIFDNLLQFIVTAGCTIQAAALAFRQKKQHYIILTCFYGSYTMGLLYWILYLGVKSYSPKIFYVSDLAWLASCIFFVMLMHAVQNKEEKNIRSPLCFVMVIISFVLLLYFLKFGDVLLNIATMSVLAGLGYLATQGYLCTKRQKNMPRKHFYLTVLWFILLEYILWLLSCVWMGDGIGNPYFWVDALITVNLFLLLPATKKAVPE